MTRRQTGKSSIIGILFRYYLFFTVIGAPVLWVMSLTLPIEGQTIHDYANETQYPATRQYIAREFAMYVAGWYGGASIPLVVGWLAMRIFGFIVLKGDPVYDAWKAQGGDLYFDNQGGLFNPDDDETRAMFFEESPPGMTICPTCSWPVGLNNGQLCGNCGTYWDDSQGSWMRPSQPPTLPPELSD